MPRLKSKPKPALPPELIGWRERVSLPKLGLGPLIAKVDTGARTAALHAEDIVIKGHHFAGFSIPDGVHRHQYELPIKGQRRVKSTSGHSEMRAVVETEIAIGGINSRLRYADGPHRHGLPCFLAGRHSRKFIVHPGSLILISRTKRKPT